MIRDLKPLLDFGERAQGQVIEQALWDRESRVKVAEPVRIAAGEVRQVFPYAPHVVGIVTPSGEALTIRAQR